MEGRVWKRPLTEVQKFEANEYVAACESGTTYWFQCNAGSPIMLMNDVYEETNGIPGLQTGMGGDTYRTGTYHACGENHEVREGETFLEGYVVQKKLLGKDEIIPVLIWTQGGTNTHCTTELHPEDWEVAKS